MARKIKEIHSELKTNFVENDDLMARYGLQRDGDDYEKFFNDNFSAASLESLLLYVVATAIASLENIFDFFKRDVSKVVEKQRYGYAGWYEQKALAFQYGDTLPFDSDTYAEIDTEKQVIKAAWCGERGNMGIQLKVSNIVDGNFEPLSADEKTAFQTYINRIKPAGIFVEVLSAPADLLKFEIDIYYNPMLMKVDGSLIEGGQKPVDEAIKNYLQSLDFNGEFVTMKFVDAIQQAQGVDIVEVKKIETKYAGYPNFTELDARRVPYSGFYELSTEPDTITINYIANV